MRDASNPGHSPGPRFAAGLPRNSRLGLRSISSPTRCNVLVSWRRSSTSWRSSGNVSSPNRCTSRTRAVDRACRAPARAGDGVGHAVEGVGAAVDPLQQLRKLAADPGCIRRRACKIGEAGVDRRRTRRERSRQHREIGERLRNRTTIVGVHQRVEVVGRARQARECLGDGIVEARQHRWPGGDHRIFLSGPRLQGSGILATGRQLDIGDAGQPLRLQYGDRVYLDRRALENGERQPHLLDVGRIQFDPAHESDIHAPVLDRRVQVEARDRVAHVGSIRDVGPPVVRATAQPQHAADQCRAEQHHERAYDGKVDLAFHACSRAARPRGP